MSRKKSNSKGFTISELIVVIFLIAMVLGLLLPALRKARTPARNAKCMNNMKQLVLAIHNYAGIYQTEMPGILHASVDGANVNPFFYSLLPYLEQDHLYTIGQTKPDMPWSAVSAAGLTVMEIPLDSAFRCPQDMSLDNWMCNSNLKLAGSSYAPNGRLFGTVTKLDKVNIPVLMPSFKIDGIPDGTANTIFIEERVAGYKDSIFTSNWCNSWAYPVQTGGTIDPETAPTANTFGSILHPADGSDKDMGQVRLQFSNQAESADTSPPVADLPLFNFKPWQADARRPGSYHTGLIQVGMGDGSVRAISASISAKTWSAAIHPDDGVLLGADW